MKALASRTLKDAGVAFQRRSKHIDISNLVKEDVLTSLHEAAKPRGLGWLRYNPEAINYESARTIINETGYRSTSIEGRVLNVDLQGNSFDDTKYNEANGEGAAEAALHGLSPKNVREAELLAKYGNSTEIGIKILTPHQLNETNETDFAVIDTVMEMLRQRKTSDATECCNQISHYQQSDDYFNWSASREETADLFIKILKAFPGTETEYSPRHAVARNLEKLAKGLGIPGFFHATLKNMHESAEKETFAVSANNAQKQMPPLKQASVDTTPKNIENTLLATQQELEKLKQSTGYILGQLDAKNASESGEKTRKKESRAWKVIGAILTGLIVAIGENFLSRHSSKPAITSPSKTKTTEDDHSITQSPGSPEKKENPNTRDKALSDAIDTALTYDLKDNALVKNAVDLLDKDSTLPEIPKDTGHFSLRRQFLLDLDAQQTAMKHTLPGTSKTWTEEVSKAPIATKASAIRQ